MASEEPAAPDTEVLAATQVVRPPRKPFYKDPLSIIGWGIALASIIAYWYFFVRKPVPKPGQQIARLTAVEGKVKVKPNGRRPGGRAALRTSCTSATSCRPRPAPAPRSRSTRAAW